MEIYGVANASNLKPLQVLQNRILKTITFSHRHHSTNDLHSKLRVLKIRDVHVFKMGTFTYKYVNNTLPRVFCNIVNPRMLSYPMNCTRSNALFSVTRHNSKHGRFLFNNSLKCVECSS